ncbi:N-formylglutamate amidohydrolase [Microbulbifer guangxiensis]|uniref:N-formylglutamate amidohydrolase n=1 Tax=Microbulbifer guangxiensis TaxID=2904249 RepID=UPI001F46DFBF|nr:N-formylglutamate amidohydrolase [Microbulbifer guangxiensis]
MIIHIPHSSTFIPPRERDSLLLDQADLEHELLRLTDWYTDELFDIPGAYSVCYPVSRIITDPERFEDDSDETAAQYGFGAIYTKTTGGANLRDHADESRHDLLERYYRPHHRKLSEAVTRELKKAGVALIIDAHSYPQDPLPFEPPRYHNNRVDVCIGTDSFHTPRKLSEALLESFRAKGYRASINVPFSGSIVPEQYYNKNPKVKSVMIEINRDLYLLKDSSEKNSHFNQLKEDVSEILRAIV